MADAEKHVEKQAQEQTGQQQVQLRIDERNMKSSYANMVRSNGTTEEVMLDFGINVVNPPSQPDATPVIVFQVSERIVMNYYSAKRLAIALSQMIRRHEDQFGELELDVNKRRKGK